MDLFDLYQHQQIRGQARDLRQTEENVQRHRKDMSAQVSQTDERIDRLTLLCEAMWDLISESTSLTTADLARKVDELDLMDGRRDGRRQHMAVDCACGAKINPKAHLCQFCSAPAPERSTFEAV